MLAAFAYCGGEQLRSRGHLLKMEGRAKMAIILHSRCAWLGRSSEWGGRIRRIWADKEFASKRWRQRPRKIDKNWYEARTTISEVWILSSSQPLCTLLGERAPWAPRSLTTEYDPNTLIYSFSLVCFCIYVRVCVWEGEGGGVHNTGSYRSLSVVLSW